MVEAKRFEPVDSLLEVVQELLVNLSELDSLVALHTAMDIGVRPKNDLIDRVLGLIKLDPLLSDCVSLGQIS